jgi:hypothetical protein
MKTPKSQQGTATLIVAVLLMLLISVTTMSATRLGIMDEKAVAAEVRTGEARQAAQAGLVHAMAWLKSNACGAGCGPLTAPTLTTASGYTYDPVITFVNHSGYILVSSTATANEEPNIQATARQFAIQLDFVSRRGKLAPPILIDGCLTDVTGGPVIYPRPDGEAVLSLATNDPGDGSGCIDLVNASGKWHAGIELCSDQGDEVACAPDDLMTAEPVEGGSEADYLGGSDLSALPEPRAWNYMFDISRDEAVAMATSAGQVYASDNDVPTGAASSVPFLIYSGSTPFNGSGTKTYGSPSSPVVLMITDPGCPNLNGSITVYGYVYYQGDPANGSCGGWGGAMTVGTVILEGDASSFNANTEFFDQVNIGGGTDATMFLDGVTTLSGTWKDW